MTEDQQGTNKFNSILKGIESLLYLSILGVVLVYGFLAYVCHYDVAWNTIERTIRFLNENWKGAAFIVGFLFFRVIRDKIETIKSAGSVFFGDKPEKNPPMERFYQSEKRTLPKKRQKK